MKRKMMAMTAMVALAAMVVCACTKEEPSQFTGEGTQEPEYQARLEMISPSAYNNVQGLNLEPGTYISIIGKQESSAYWKELERGVEQAAEDLNTLLGYTGSDKIKVVYNGAAKSEDINEQVNILDEELSRYPDVLGLASVDEDACTVQLDLATSNGIPIIAFDSGNTYQGILCTVKTDNLDAARTGAYKLADEIGGQGQVILLVNDSESESARERAESFLQEMKENQPNIEVVEVIYLDKMSEYKKTIVEEKLKEQAKEDVEGENDMTGGQSADEGQVSAGGDKNQNLQDGEKPSGDAQSTASGNAGASENEDEQSTASGNVGTSENGDEQSTASGNAGASENEDEQSTASGNAGTSENGDEQSETDENTEASQEAPAGPTEEEKAAMANSMSDEDVLLYCLEKYPDLKGMFGTSFLATQTGLKVLRRAERDIVLMGFDAGKEQLDALESGEIRGLVVQNPFGMGYAAVVAAARTVLEIGNEAQVDTGYIWVTQENMEEESIKRLLYE